MKKSHRFFCVAFWNTRYIIAIPLCVAIPLWVVHQSISHLYSIVITLIDLSTYPPLSLLFPVTSILLSNYTINIFYDSINKGDHTIFFLTWLILLSEMISRYIHIVAKDSLFFLCWNESV